jgi:hypothetical protein
MVGFEFSRSEVEALASKLDSLQHELTAHEQALLVDVFALARSHVIPVQPRGPGEPEPTSVDLKEQILEAFLPEEGTEFIFQLMDKITGEPRPCP